MPPYSKKDLADAAAFRAAIHKEALRKARRRDPQIEEVYDRHPVEAYFRNVWDYPGAWYLYVSIPEGYDSRDALVEDIVRDTIRYHHTEPSLFEKLSSYVPTRIWAKLTSKPGKTIDE